VIMLTARGDDIDRIIGLEFGADDYLAKPFNPRELTARIKAILRRARNDHSNVQQLSLGGIDLNVRTRVAMVDGKELTLTGTEFEILKFLLEVPGEVVSKEQLSERALGRRLLPYDRSIDTHISNLRGKLERADSESTRHRLFAGPWQLVRAGKQGNTDHEKSFCTVLFVFLVNHRHHDRCGRDRWFLVRGAYARHHGKF